MNSQVLITATPVAVATGVPQPDHVRRSAVSELSAHRTATSEGRNCGLPAQSASRWGAAEAVGFAGLLQPAASSASTAATMARSRYLRSIKSSRLPVTFLDLSQVTLTSLLTDCHATMIPCATVLSRDMSRSHG